MKKVFFGVLTIMASSGVFANSPYDNCMSKYEYASNASVMECSDHASDIYKKQITKHYKKIYAHIKAEDPEGAKAFEKSQQSWIAFRDSHCSLMGRYVGTPMYGYCPMEMNKERAEELEELADMMP